MQQKQNSKVLNTSITSPQKVFWMLSKPRRKKNKIIKKKLISWFKAGHELVQEVTKPKFQPLSFNHEKIISP